MKLSVENIANVLLKTESECPFCGDKTEICAYHDAGGLQVKMFCDSCGTQKDFVDFLVSLEKESEVKR
jgi:transcription elongation factor Elf1